MATILAYLASHSVLLLFILLGVGMLFGRIKIRGIGLDAAAVLFFAIALAAYGKSQGIELHVAKELGTLGLALFAFAIGINSGPNFFAVFRTAGGPIISMLAIFGLAAGAGVALGKWLGMTGAQIAGTFAGAITNTPALDAAGSASGNLTEATVGYSISYLWGVVGMLTFATLALAYGRNDKDTPSPIISRTVRVDRSDRPRIGEIFEEYGEQVTFSRLQHGEGHELQKPNMSDKLEQGDLITVVGNTEHVNAIVQELGHHSSHSLLAERSELDFRRITLSDPKHAGKTIADLNLGDKFCAVVSRVRRGDVEMVGSPDLVLLQGDRLRIVAPHDQIKKVTEFLGDSTRGLTDINPIALGFGMTLGILLGETPLFNPLGGTFTIGAAAGTLIVGLIMGKIGRIGPMVTALPFTTCQVLSEFGLLIFLAQAGLNAGGEIAHAFTGGDWWKMLLVGFVVTTIVGAGMFIIMRWFFHMGGTRLAGLLGGVQTQPAILAYCNGRTNMDPRIALGYAMVYPVAMVAKILFAKFIGMV